MMQRFWVYLIANQSGGLYLGVTNDIERRIAEHKSGDLPGHAQRYRKNRLVYLEEFDRIRDAIEREKQLKRWRREKKVVLIESVNPEWQDLFYEPVD
jgi:putative endonuclease